MIIRFDKAKVVDRHSPAYRESAEYKEGIGRVASLALDLWEGESGNELTFDHFLRASEALMQDADEGMRGFAAFYHATMLELKSQGCDMGLMLERPGTPPGD